MDYTMTPGQIRAKEIFCAIFRKEPELLHLQTDTLLNPESPGYLLDKAAWYLARTAPLQQEARLRALVKPLLALSAEGPRLCDGKTYRCWDTRQVLRYFWRYRCREATYWLLPADEQDHAPCSAWMVRTFQTDGDWAIEFQKGGRDYLYLLTYSDKIKLRYRERERQMLQFLQTDKRIWLSENR